MTTRCSTCGGHGEIPTGGQTMTSATSMSWGTCPTCHGAGTVTECERCMNTGIDLEAPVNLANPPQCPCCHIGQEAA